ncbi:MULTISPECIES: ATP-binding protein [Polaromonas]|uniref:ATP-binding protein n=2 Tax=Polaromonas TaxID=52972 RepID=A0ABW1TTL8_9BURK
MRELQVEASRFATAVEGLAATVARCWAFIRKTLSGVFDLPPEFMRIDHCTLFVGPPSRVELLDSCGFACAEPVELDLCNFSSALSNRMRPTLGQRIDIAMYLETDCPACRVDRYGFEAAVLHLVMNAREAMHQGGRLTIDIRKGVLATGKPAVAVSICDDGRGMRAEVAQQDRAGTGRFRVETFVRQSGGDMQMRTLPGLGTTVTLNFPYQSRLPVSEIERL